MAHETDPQAVDRRMHRIDAYIKTIDRIEPEVALIDPGAFYASAAISLKRIADALERLVGSIEEKNK